jgi:hypothetical protein
VPQIVAEDSLQLFTIITACIRYTFSEMSFCRSFVLLVTLVTFGLQSLSAETVHIRMAWIDLEPMIRGHNVIVRTSGASLRGRALMVEKDSLLLEVRKTSDAAAYPKGRTSVPRAAIQEITLVQYVGNGRRIGKFIGGALGLTFGLLAAVAIGFKENPETVGRRKVFIAILVPGSLIGGLLGGYLLGRLADREITVIEVIPRQPATSSRSLL